MSRSRKTSRETQKSRVTRSTKPNLRTIREAVSNYIGSEGCSCCQGPDHKEHQAALGKILRVRKYGDGSGYAFAEYAT